MALFLFSESISKVRKFRNQFDHSLRSIKLKRTTTFQNFFQKKEKIFSKNMRPTSIDGLGFFQEGGQTRPPRMLKFFSGGKVGVRGGKQGINQAFWFQPLLHH